MLLHLPLSVKWGRFQQWRGPGAPPLNPPLILATWRHTTESASFPAMLLVIRSNNLAGNDEMVAEEGYREAGNVQGMSCQCLVSQNSSICLIYDSFLHIFALCGVFLHVID